MGRRTTPPPPLLNAYCSGSATVAFSISPTSFLRKDGIAEVRGIPFVRWALTPAGEQYSPR